MTTFSVILGYSWSSEAAKLAAQIARVVLPETLDHVDESVL